MFYLDKTINLINQAVKIEELFREQNIDPFNSEEYQLIILLLYELDKPLEKELVTKKNVLFLKYKSNQDFNNKLREVLFRTPEQAKHYSLLNLLTTTTYKLRNFSKSQQCLQKINKFKKSNFKEKIPLDEFGAALDAQHEEVFNMHFYILSQSSSVTKNIHTVYFDEEIFLNTSNVKISFSSLSTDLLLEIKNELKGFLNITEDIDIEDLITRAKSETDINQQGLTFLTSKYELIKNFISIMEIKSFYNKINREHSNDLTSQNSTIILDNIDKKTSFYNSSKSMVTKLMSYFLTKYGHAGVLFQNYDKKISHINPYVTVENFKLSNFLYSEQYKIKLESLIDPENLLKLQDKHSTNWKFYLEQKMSKIEITIHSKLAEEDRKKYIVTGKRQDTMASQVVGSSGALHTGFKNHLEVEEIRASFFGGGDSLPNHMICSEFASYVTIASLAELDKQLKEELGIQGSIINLPFSKKERIENIHPERLLRILQDKGCIEQFQNPFVSQYIDTQPNTEVKTYYSPNLNANLKMLQTLSLEIMLDNKIPIEDKAYDAAIKEIENSPLDFKLIDTIYNLKKKFPKLFSGEYDRLLQQVTEEQLIEESNLAINKKIASLQKESTRNWFSWQHLMGDNKVDKLAKLQALHLQNYKELIIKLEDPRTSFNPELEEEKIISINILNILTMDIEKVKEELLQKDIYFLKALKNIQQEKILFDDKGLNDLIKSREDDLIVELKLSSLEQKLQLKQLEKIDDSNILNIDKINRINENLQYLDKWFTKLEDEISDEQYQKFIEKMSSTYNVSSINDLKYKFSEKIGQKKEEIEKAYNEAKTLKINEILEYAKKISKDDNGVFAFDFIFKDPDLDTLKEELQKIGLYNNKNESSIQMQVNESIKALRENKKAYLKRIQYSLEDFNNSNIQIIIDEIETMTDFQKEVIKSHVCTNLNIQDFTELPVIIASRIKTFTKSQETIDNYLNGYKGTDFWREVFSKNDKSKEILEFVESIDNDSIRINLDSSNHMLIDCCENIQQIIQLNNILEQNLNSILNGNPYAPGIEFYTSYLTVNRNHYMLNSLFKKKFKVNFSKENISELIKFNKKERELKLQKSYYSLKERIHIQEIKDQPTINAINEEIELHCKDMPEKKKKLIYKDLLPGIGDEIPLIFLQSKCIENLSTPNPAYKASEALERNANAKRKRCDQGPDTKTPQPNSK